MSATVTIDRASLSLAPLVITGDPTQSRWLSVVDRPAFEYRRGYAPDSAWQAGSVLLSAVLEASSVPVTIYHRAADAPALRALDDELAAALGQWSYDLTLTVDGVATVYRAEIAAPSFALDEGLVQARMSRASVVIPVNPA